MMGFDEFMARGRVTALPVERFRGFVVDVGVPPLWEPFDSVTGMRIWVCRNDPYIESLCANAVLTMHAVDASLDAREAFDMLAEQQLRSAQGCREVRREFGEATEGVGAIGSLVMQMTEEFGVVVSVSQSRIIAVERETLIAQLTVTALQESPASRENVWMTVRMIANTSSVSAGPRGVPPIGRREEH